MVINGYNIVPGANLIGANLSWANLFEANLEGANLEEAILTGAILKFANLTGANLTGAILKFANLTGAILTGANLTGADLKRANLKRCDLRGADLRGTNLRGADLRGADLRGANITGADLTGAILPEASSLKSCLALNSDIEGAITNVNQLLNLIESNKNNEEESNIYKGHLKWIEDNMEALIRNNHITDKDKATIDDYNDRRDLSRLAQCSRDTKMAADEMLSSKGLGEGLGKGLTDLVEFLSAKMVFGEGRGR